MVQLKLGQNNMKNKNGYIALSSVLVIMAVVLIIGSSVSFLSINEMQSALSSKKSEESLHLVEGCAEDALLRLNKNNSIPLTIIIPEGSCSVTIDSHIGNNWTFTVSSTIINYKKNIQISAVRDSTVTITSWIEL
jgi:hypothetical protein